jgi:hypothetical protein
MKKEFILKTYSDLTRYEMKDIYNLIRKLARNNEKYRVILF